MNLLAGISGKEAIKKLQTLGYKVIRQKGSHVRLVHSKSDIFKPLTIPVHKELKMGLLNQLIKDINLTIDEFLEL